MILTLGLLAACAPAWLGGPAAWSPAELAQVRALALRNLPPLPPDPSNRVADDPQAAALGRQLFFDPRLSGNGAVACATCHVPGLYFSDGRTLAQGMGIISRHSMALLGAAYSPWYTWDGKADSLWGQAFGPLESPGEQGGNRVDIARTVLQNYGPEYTALFGPPPDVSDPVRFPSGATPAASAQQATLWTQMDPADQDAINRVVTNMAKAIGAYERTLLPQPSRFDRYVASLDDSGRPVNAAADAQLSADELAGLRLFLGKAQCVNCHNGPLFTNFEFHNTAVPPVPGFPLDHGRSRGIELLRASEFSCLGPYSDAQPEQCGETRFLKAQGDTLDGSFRTPSLRNVAATAPYMHAGQFHTLEEVVTHYNSGGLALLGHNELVPLDLAEQEQRQLVAFLKTLTGPLPEVNP